MSNKNIGKPLTVDLVFTKTKSDSLQNIKNLNLWGNDLQDLKLIQKMPNLEVVSLSVNKIKSLKDFSTCTKLQELYLRKNNISDLNQIKHLVKLPTLKVLWLHDNPCAQGEGYREIVIKYLPNLMKLDNHPVTPQERQNSQKVNSNLGNNNYNDDQQQQYGIQKSPYQNEKAQYEEQKWSKPQSGYSNASNHQRVAPPVSNHQSNSNYYQEQKINNSEDKWVKRPSTSQQQQQPKRKQNYPKQQQITRNQNILMAVLSLMRELDPGSLEIVKREADKLSQ